MKTGSGESRSWVRIPLPPPSSPSVLVLTGESLEIRACACDLRLWMDPENVSGGANRGNTLTCQVLGGFQGDPKG